MIAGVIGEEVLFRPQLGVIEQSVLGGAVVARTMVEVVRTEGFLLVLDCLC